MRKIMFIVALIATTFTACQKDGIAPEKTSSTLTSSTKSINNTIAADEPTDRQLKCPPVKMTLTALTGTTNTVGAGDSIAVDWNTKAGDLVAFQLNNNKNKTTLVIGVASGAQAGTVLIDGASYPVVKSALGTVHIALPGTAVLNGIGYGDIYTLEAYVIDPVTKQVIGTGESQLFSITN